MTAKVTFPLHRETVAEALVQCSACLRQFPFKPMLDQQTRTDPVCAICSTVLWPADVFFAARAAYLITKDRNVLYRMLGIYDTVAQDKFCKELVGNQTSVGWRVGGGRR